MTDDPLEEICDAIVASLNAAQDDPNVFNGFQIEAVNIEDPNAELDKKSSIVRVLLWPHAESETKIGRDGKVLERFDVSLLVIRDLESGITTKLLHGLCRSIKLYLRGRRMAGYAYSGSQSTKADLERLHDNKRFASATIITYSGTA